MADKAPVTADFMDLAQSYKARLKFRGTPAQLADLDLAMRVMAAKMTQDERSKTAMHIWTEFGDSETWADVALRALQPAS
jgi:hypothetical protein